MASRSTVLALWLALLVAPLASSVRAEEPEVPARIQAELLAKVVGYDRTFAARAGYRALVLVAVRAGDADSERVGAALVAELQRQRELGRLPHEERIVRYTDARALAAACREHRATILYLSAGLSDDVPEIAKALEGVSVLSVSAIARYVEHGIALGFSAESGKPKIVIHLTQARRQGIDFRADLLKLAKVVP